MSLSPLPLSPLFTNAKLSYKYIIVKNTYGLSRKLIMCVILISGFQRSCLHPDFWNYPLVSWSCNELTVTYTNCTFCLFVFTKPFWILTFNTKAYYFLEPHLLKIGSADFILLHLITALLTQRKMTASTHHQYRRLCLCILLNGFSFCLGRASFSSPHCVRHINE